jgi:hypothetical protein
MDVSLLVSTVLERMESPVRLLLGTAFGRLAQSFVGEYKLQLGRKSWVEVVLKNPSRVRECANGWPPSSVSDNLSRAASPRKIYTPACDQTWDEISGLLWAMMLLK